MHALLFSDVVDSTALVERLGDERAARLWAEHDRLARTLITRHGGQEIDRSDGFFVLFAQAAAALAFAAAYHDALAPLALAARVAIHQGEVALRRNAAADVARGAKPIEVEGLAKPLAARILSLAGGGQTLLSEAARLALDGPLPPGVQLQPLGHYKLKGIEQPLALFGAGTAAALAPPPPDGDKAWRVVQRDGLWQPLREVPHNLAPERDAFVGRAAELRALARLLDGGVRQVTLSGVGGTGKTRLACRYARAWLGDWPGGAYFCDLSEARSIDGICAAVARALSVPLGRDDPVEQLARALAARGRCLVLLDNFEQVVAHAHATLGRWLDATTAHVVVTSRERLHLAGEQVLPLEPLPAVTEGVELFVARARAQQPSFAPTPAVAELVRLLDGLPLAIELAAARVRTLSPEQMLERLRDRFALLAAPRAATARQATLRAAIDWSWDLLSPPEQSALAELSVFEGAFTVEAAEAAVDLRGLAAAPPVFDVVQSLVDKSLLRSLAAPPDAADSATAPARLGMFLSIRDYAAERLQRRGDDAVAAAQRRHGRFYAAFGADASIDALQRGADHAARDRLMLQLDNVLATCSRAIERSDAAIAAAAYRAAWEGLAARGPLALGVSLGAAILQLPSLASAERIGTLAVQAEALRQCGRMTDAHAAATEALALAIAATDASAQARIRMLLGRILVDQGQPDDAITHQELALAQFRREGDRSREARARLVLGAACQLRGQAQLAIEHCAAALADIQAMGDTSSEASARIAIGLIEQERGHYDVALEHDALALALLRRSGDRSREATLLINIANAHNEQGRLDLAQQHLEQALELAQRAGQRGMEATVLGNLANVRANQGRLGDAESLLNQAIALQRAAGNHRSVAIGLINLGDACWRQGRFADALRCSDEALQIARSAGLPRLESHAMIERAGVLLDWRRLDGVRELLDGGRRLLRELDDQIGVIAADCLSGELDLIEGRADAAAQRLHEAESAAQRLGLDVNPDVDESLRRLRAALAPRPAA